MAEGLFMKTLHTLNEGPVALDYPSITVVAVPLANPLTCKYRQKKTIFGERVTGGFAQRECQRGERINMPN